MKALLEDLAVFFPSGFDERRAAAYAQQLQRQQVDRRDLAEAVERLKVTRRERTFPPLAELLRACSEARSDRLRAERATKWGDEERQRLATPDEIDAVLTECAQMRALHAKGLAWCGIHCAYEPVLPGRSWTACRGEEYRRQMRGGIRMPTAEETRRAWVSAGSPATKPLPASVRRSVVTVDLGEFEPEKMEW